MKLIFWEEYNLKWFFIVYNIKSQLDDYFYAFLVFEFKYT